MMGITLGFLSNFIGLKISSCSSSLQSTQGTLGVAKQHIIAVKRSQSNINSISPKVQEEMLNLNVFISTYSVEKYKHLDCQEQCCAVST